MTRLCHPGMVTMHIPLWLCSVKSGPALNKLSLAPQGVCQDGAPHPQCVSVSLWGSVFGVCLGLLTWLSIVPPHGLQWDFCTCAQLLAGSRRVFLRIFVHRFLCLGLGSNVLLGVASFARDKISHPLPNSFCYAEHILCSHTVSVSHVSVAGTVVHLDFSL